MSSFSVVRTRQEVFSPPMICISVSSHRAVWEQVPPSLGLIRFCLFIWEKQMARWLFGVFHLNNVVCVRFLRLILLVNLCRSLTYVRHILWCCAETEEYWCSAPIPALPIAMHSTYVKMAMDRQRAELRNRRHRRLRTAMALQNKMKDCCRKITAFFFTQVYPNETWCISCFLAKRTICFCFCFSYQMILLEMIRLEFVDLLSDIQ